VALKFKFSQQGSFNIGNLSQIVRILEVLSENLLEKLKKIIFLSEIEAKSSKYYS